MLKQHSLTTGQAARLCSVTPDTVLKWVKTGRLSAARTVGGHYRIDARDLAPLRADTSARRFRFCWEYNSKGGAVLEGCRDCLVYRARALRCYELVKLSPTAGHSKLFCKTTCEECEYYRLVKGQAANVLVVSNNPELAASLRRQAFSATFNLKVTDCEYALSALVESFRPDFAVIDCSLGSHRARDIASHLLHDPRVRLARIILAARPGEFPRECDKQVFARIERPFELEHIAECINGIREAIW
ncbi:MAG: helix-turn-helix domain-containing protein [Planctomycetota bacterium]